MKGFDKLDRGRGSGARTTTEDFVAEKRSEQENSFSKSRTTFRESDISGSDHDWHRLKRINDSRPKGEDKNFFRDAGRSEDAELFCDILEISGSLKEEILSIVDSFEFNSKRYGGKSHEKLILVIINLAHDRTIGEDGSYEDRIIYIDSYSELMDVVGLGETERRQLRQQVREKSDEF